MRWKVQRRGRRRGEAETACQGTTATVQAKDRDKEECKLQTHGNRTR